MTNPNDAIASAIAANASQPASDDKLAELRAHASMARDQKQVIDEMEERLAGLKKQLTELLFKTLPDLMDAAGVDHVGLPAQGNSPAVDFRLRPFYSASIAAVWPHEKKEAAFDWLKSHDAGDLIKTQVSASLPKGDLELAEKLVEAAARLKITAALTLNVHSQTLTAWLREQVEGNHRIFSSSELEILGASIGRVVKPQERKE